MTARIQQFQYLPFQHETRLRVLILDTDRHLTDSVLNPPLHGQNTLPSGGNERFTVKVMKIIRPVGLKILFQAVLRRICQLHSF